MMEQNKEKRFAPKKKDLKRAKKKLKSIKGNNEQEKLSKPPTPPKPPKPPRPPPVQQNLPTDNQEKVTVALHRKLDSIKNANKSDDSDSSGSRFSDDEVDVPSSKPIANSQMKDETKTPEKQETSKYSVQQQQNIMEGTGVIPPSIRSPYGQQYQQSSYPEFGALPPGMQVGMMQYGGHPGMMAQGMQHEMAMQSMKMPQIATPGFAQRGITQQGLSPNTMNSQYVQLCDNKIPSGIPGLDSVTRIRLSNLPAAVKEKDIKRYLEKKKFENIQNIAIDESTHAATCSVDGKSKQAGRALQKGCIQLKDQMVKVEIITPSDDSSGTESDSDTDTESSQTSSNENEQPEAEKKTPKETKIKITPISRRVEEIDLRKYFEEKINITSLENIEIDNTNKCAILTFSEEKDAESLIAKSPMKFKKRDIHAEKIQLNDEEHSSDGEESDSSPESEVDNDIQRYSIEIAGFHHNTPESEIKKFCESKISRGSIFCECEIDKTNGRARISYEKEEDMEKALRKAHRTKLEGIQLSAKQYSPALKRNVKSEIETELHKDGLSSSVKVSNLPEKVTSDNLRNYFSKISGGKVKCIKINRGDLTAVVTLEEPKAARMVLRKSSYSIDDKRVKVEPNSMPESNSDSDHSSDIRDESEPNCTVEISGINEKLTDFILEMWFENEKKSGGGPIEEMIPIREDGLVRIKYKDESVASRVLSRQQHIEGKELKVKLYRPPRPETPRPCYKDRVFVSDIDPKTSKTTLEMYFELMAGVATKEITVGTEDGTVLVNFENEIDFTAFENACKKKSLDSKYVTVIGVPISNCILVSDVKHGTSAGTVSLYFEFTRKSGGGPVVETKMVDNGSFLVTFEDVDVAENVCDRKHILDGKEVKVEMHYECLQQYDQLKVPETFAVKIDEDKLGYILHSQKSKDMFEMQISHLHGEVLWPSDPSKEVHIQCILTKDTPNIRNLAKVWQNNIQDCLDEFCNSFVAEKLRPLRDVWDAIKQDLQTQMDNKTDLLTVVMNENDKVISIVGPTEEALAFLSEAKMMINQKEESFQEKKHHKMDKIPVSNSQQLKLLEESGVFKDVIGEYNDMTVKADMDNKAIIFTGPPEDVGSCKNKIYEAMIKIMTGDLEDVSSQYMEFIHTKPVEQYIKTELKKKDCIVAWEADNIKKVKVFAMSDTEIKSAVKYLRDIVVETKFDDITKQSRILLSSSKFQDKVQEIQIAYPGLVVIKSMLKQAEIQIICLKHIAGAIREILNDFFAKNTIGEIFQKLTEGQLQFVAMHCKEEMDSISKRFDKYQVTVEIVDKEICIRGTKEGLKKARKDVEAMVSKISTKKHQLTKQSTISYIQTPSGQTKIEQIQREKRCVIIPGVEDAVENIDEIETPRSLAPQEFAVCHLPGGQIIYTQCGCMTRLEAIDIYVNAANQGLDHQSGLAKDLIEQGGQSIQTECDCYIKQNGSMEDGEIFCSGSGSLPCKKLVHAVVPIWQGGNHDEKEFLQLAVSNSLTECDDQNLSSIAIPGLATGAFGFPMIAAAKAIVEEIKQYLQDNANSKIKFISLCDVDDKMVNTFTEVLVEFYGEDKVTKKKTDGGWRITNEDQGAVGPKLVQTKQNPCVPVRVIKGEIAKQQADVIVNTTSSNLDLMSGAVSKSILQEAGPEIQADCSQRYSDGILVGQVAMTGGFNLKSSVVFHVCLPKWNAQAPSVVGELMILCLTMAENDGMNVIAFPALGTGNLKYPRDTIAEIMFRSVEEFYSKHPHSSITDVQFVVYDKDTETIKAFEKEASKRCDVTAQTKEDTRKTRDFSAEFDNADTTKRQAVGTKPKGFTVVKTDTAFNIGNIKFSMYQGDITKAKTDAIVNSTTKAFDCGGAVTRILLQHGGDQLKREMETQKSSMSSKGYAVTSGGRLPFSCIIHVATQNSEREWKAILLKVLRKADENNCISLAFPALGTGAGGCIIENITRNIIDAILDYSNSGKCGLKEVHFVIFDRSMFDSARKEAQQYLPMTVTAGQRGIFGKMFDYVTGFGGGTAGREDQRRCTGAQTHEFVPGASTNLPSIILYITSDTERAINNAIKELEDEFDHGNQKKVFKDPFIKSLTETQQQEIKNLSNIYGVDVKVEVKVGRIQLQGMVTQDLLSAYDFIHEMIRKAERVELRKQEAKRIAAMVEWNFIEITADGPKLEPYPESVSLSLETAYQNKKDQQVIKASGVDYIVDFKEMTEYPTNDPTDQVTVIRKEKSEKVITNKDIPAHWSPMKDDENVALTLLDPKDQEYQDVVKAFKDSIGSAPSDVVKVERVQNRALYHQYIAKRDQIEHVNPPNHVNERILFHGTAEDAIVSINLYGFNRSYCGKNAVVHGEGVYFAVSSSYSARDTYSPANGNGHKHMYICRVLTGEFEKAATGMRVPPPKPFQASHILYDSVVDNKNDPKIFVIFHDTQAYPEYLITFK